MIAAEQLNIGRGRVRSREITARTLGASAGGRRRAGTAEGWGADRKCPANTVQMQPSLLV
jgi:hypothetical protein